MRLRLQLALCKSALSVKFPLQSNALKCTQLRTQMKTLETLLANDFDMNYLHLARKREREKVDDNFQVSNWISSYWKVTLIKKIFL